MAKIKNIDIYQSREHLVNLSKEKFPVKTSYQIAKLMASLKNQYDVIEQVRLGLVKKYGEEKDGVINIQPNSDNMAKFFEEMNILFNQEIEVVFDKIILPDSLVIEPSKLLALEKFISIE